MSRSEHKRTAAGRVRMRARSNRASAASASERRAGSRRALAAAAPRAARDLRVASGLGERPAPGGERRGALAGVVVTIAFSASVFAGIRAGLRSYGPFQLVAFRFILASLLLLALARPLGVGRPRRRDLPALLALGFCGIGAYQVALAIGEQHVSAGVTSMVVASQTIMVAGLATVFLGERLPRLGWLGALLGVTGVAVISLSGSGGLNVDLQVLWLLLAALGSSVYFVFQKPLLRRYTALEMTTWCIWAGTIFVLPFAWRLPAQIAAAQWSATASVVYLAVFPGVVAYLAWTYALARAPASIVVNALCLVPPLAVVIAFFWLGERPTWLELCGGLVTVAGVALVGWKGMAVARGGSERPAP